VVEAVAAVTVALVP